MGGSFAIGRLSGIPIRIHVTFVLFIVWLFASYWKQGGVAVAASAIVYILLLFGCVVLHEFGHILTARRFGAETVDVVLLPIGGVARMKNIPERPGQELAVAIAGPIVNLVIAGVLLSLVGSEELTRELSNPGQSMAIVPQLAAANLFLALFNLIPAFPMDGGRVLRALFAYRLGRTAATALATRIGHVLAIGFGIFGFMTGNPLLILVAAFVYFGASAENRDTRIKDVARHVPVADVMITRFATVPIEGRIADATDLLIHSTQHDIPVIDGVGKVIGLLTRNQVLRTLRERGHDAAIADAIHSEVPTVPVHAMLDAAVRLMDDAGTPAVVVVDSAGHPVGLVSLEHLGQRLMLGRVGHGV